MPKKKPSSKPRPFYQSPPPKPLEGVTGDTRRVTGKTKPVGRAGGRTQEPRAETTSDIPHAHLIASAPFTLREDGQIEPCSRDIHVAPIPATAPEERNLKVAATSPRLVYQSDSPFIRLYHGNSLELLDAIAAKYPEGRFDAIFADPPYFLSNGGITCHAGKMVKVDKGDWDKSRGPELNHEFNLEWLRRCQKVLKPNGTLWVTGTHHVIFSVGYALQQLGYKILNDIAWEKPNPPPNLSCRYFTHSTETILWAAKNDKSKHVFNYQDMRKVTGKQMKTVWRGVEDAADSRWEMGDGENPNSELPSPISQIKPSANSDFSSVWTLGAPTNAEKEFGKHPTQKPVALVERCLLASTHPGDLVLDPFLGGGTTAVAAVRLNRGCVGVEADAGHLALAIRRADREIIELWLRTIQVRVIVSLAPRLSGARVRVRGNLENELLTPALSSFGEERETMQRRQNDLAIFSETINRSRDMADAPELQTERIFHETKFVFLSCAHVERGTVVHTTVDVSLQEAWAKTPTGKKRETTHIVWCETEIFRVK